jgi:hypothetical protein
MLRPTLEQSFSYPCDNPKGQYCARKIIKESHLIFALCSHTPKQCGKTPLQKEDVIIYECDYRQLSRVIANVIGVNLNFSVTEYSYSFRIGTITGANNMSVYLALVNNASQLENIITGIYATINAPFMLLFPTPNLLSYAAETLFKSTGCIGVALSECIGKNRSGDFVALCPIENLLPSSFPGNTNRNAIPDAAAWHDIKMQFRDGHTISISCQSTQFIANFTQLGMVNTRNGEPTKQWQLLQVLGESYGQLSWRNPAAHVRLQKQKELLSKNLRDYFGINDDPIVWDNSERCYKTKFMISPEGD